MPVIGSLALTLIGIGDRFVYGVVVELSTIVGAVVSITTSLTQPNEFNPPGLGRRESRRFPAMSVRPGAATPKAAVDM
jgi:hypothetical protein